QQQDRAAVGGAPAVEIAVLPRLAAEPPPDDATGDAEFRREGWPDGWMPEGVRRVEHVRPATKPLRVGAAEQEIADERLPRRHQLVGEHVPGSHLQAALAHESGDPPALLRADAEVVL